MDLVDILAGLGPENLAEKRKALMQWRINSAMGMLAPTTGTGVEAATRMLPMTGEAWTANDAGNAIQDGQYGKAAMMGLLGLLPLGGMMSAGLRAGASVPKRMGQSGAIAWHGSPHKFDKFSLDKIGTGEGAQAYGHGLYLAEAPDVAKSYQALHGAAELRKGGNRVAMYGSENKGVLDELARHGGNFDSAIASQEKLAKDYNGMFAGNANKIKQTLEEWRANGYEAVPLGNMYKTDLPDEAVARFLDWDKPLSQQAPEVQAALGDLALKNQAHIGRVPIRQFIYDKTQQTGSLPSVVIGEIEKAGSLDAAIPALQRKFSGANDAAKSKLDELLATLKQQQISMQTGVDSVRTGGDIVRGGYNPPEIAQMLQSKGIPGIRYLDGGSRGAGQGSSNFVAFDPELIRILERNGIPTGNQPWKPGEWQGMLSGTK